MNAEIKERIEMINKGEVPEGYKKTKVGIIPENWEVETLSDINTIVTGATPLRSNNKYFNGNIPWVKTTDLNNSYIIDTEEKITELALKETSVKYVEKNSILVAMYGGFNQIGRTGLMKIRGTTNQAISSFLVDEVNYNSEYVLHWLNANRNFWRKFAASSRKDPNITKKDVEDFPIIKLNYLEQQKIAQILFTWDQAIELKEKLIEEKKEQKKGLMQKLLTGEVRLPGFDGEWEEVRLEEVLFSPKKEIVQNPQDYYLLTVKLHLNGIEATDKKPNKTKRGRPYYIRKPKELLIGRQNFHNGGIGIVPDEMESYIASNAISTLEAKEGDIKFYYYYLSNANFYKRIGHIVGGTGQKEISETEMKKLKLIIPKSSNEQKAIAKILSTADKEIELLNQELEQLKLQKKGLMQLLLTGIIRVKS